MTVKENEQAIKRMERLYERLSEIVVGNGKRGMDEIIRDIEKQITEVKSRMGVLESDMRHLKNVYFQREGLDALGNPPPKKPAPKTWWGKAWERIGDNLFDKFITAVIIVILFNLPELFDWFIKLLK